MSEPRPVPACPIAIVALDVLLPGTPGKPGFWRDVVAARDCITDVPPSHWLLEDYYDPDPSAEDKTYCHRGGFLDPVKFDPLAFGVPPAAMASTDTAQLLALVLARRVLDQASDATVRSIDRARTSIILGVASATELVVHLGGRLQRPNWIEGMRQAGLPESQVQKIAQSIADTYVPWSEASFPGLLGNVVAGRIANRLDLGGSNYVTDAACASSLSAVQAGINELRLGEADTVIAGGVDALNDILMYMCFSKTPAFSPTGDCRPFSDKADGTILGEGLAMLALRRLEDAEADGNHIYGVIRGIGSASDGQATSVYAPKPEGQAQALRRAYERAGYSPATVELMEAHGTGTVAGDAAEFAGLRSVFGLESDGRKGWCAIGSIKSQIGHTKAAAGAAGLFKAVMALNQKVLPPTAKVDRPNPKLGIGESPFYINKSARPWVRGSDHPRRASVSSFGFGGSNFHLTIEEYTGSGRRPETVRLMPSELYLLSAKDAASLANSARAAAAEMESGGDLARLAAAAADAFDPAAGARLAIVASDVEDLAAKLAGFAAQPDGRLAGTWVGSGKPAGGKTAFLFPGQGSQYPGMGADLAISFAAARAVWDEAADLEEFTDVKLHDIAFPPHAFDAETAKADRDRLTAMANAQPAIGAVSAAQLALLVELGLAPDAVAGHSYGEVTALFAAGTYDRKAMLRIARNRGRLMTEAANGRAGGMIALPVGRDEAETLLARSGADLVIANNNGPSQVVLSGAAEAVEKAMTFFAAEGLSAIRLPVANAFHSEIVAASVGPFRAALDSVPMESPSLPVYAGATGRPYDASEDGIRTTLAGQIAQPIDFRKQVEALYESGIRRFVEVGPASVLTGLVKQCLGDRPHLALSLDRKGENGIVSFLSAVAELAAAGVALDYAWLWRDAPPDAEEKAAPKHAVNVGGSNLGKPYPPVDGAAGKHAPNPERPAGPAPAPANTAAPVTAASAPAPIPTPAAPAPVADVAFHRHLAETHLAFQQAMADSHRAFLQTMERLAGGSASADIPGTADLPSVPSSTPDSKMPAPAPQPAPQVMAPPPGMEVRPSAPAAIAPTQAEIPAPATIPPPQMQTAPKAAVDVAETVIALVAEKTGYPADMLSLDMDLEADLGIDSIKQVEILSSLRDALPGLGEPDPGMIAEMGTLRRIVAYVEDSAGDAVSPAAPANEPVQAAAAAGLDADILLAVVAEKTGYPADMLSLDMELEGDLGIDSIKQVEILSAIRDQHPEMPEIDPGQLAELRTLGAILGFIGAAEAPAAPVEAEPQTAALSGHGLDSSVLLSVVAEKTGYPEDMLSLDMELEGDLGIDSIKQVEILSAVRDQFPDLPEIDPGQLAELRTLGAIQDFLAGNGGDEPTAQASLDAGELPAVRPEPVRDVSRWVIRARHAPASGRADAGIVLAGDLVIVPASSALAVPLAEALRERGLRVKTAERADANCAGLVYLGASLDEARTATGQESVVDAVMAAATVAPRLAADGGLFVTIEDLGGDFGIGGSGDRAWGSGLAGLAGTAAREWPKARVKAIDIDFGRRSVTDAAVALADEILIADPATEVALSTTEGRQVPVPTAASLMPVSGRSGLRDGMVIVASAGARGITAASLIEFARHYRLKLALLGRTAYQPEDTGLAEARDEPALIRLLATRTGGRKIDPGMLRAKARSILQGRQIAATISSLEELGSEVRYVAVDICDADAVAGAVAGIRADWGPVDGLVHGAGVLADRRLEDKTAEQVRAVADTKIAGLRNLLAATAGDPLEMICLFSSAAAVAGNEGQSDYAMANRMLDNIASSLQADRPECVVKSVAWGPWDGGMVDDGLRALFRARGIDLIPLDSGTAFLRRELEAGSADCRVIAGSADLGSRPARNEPGEDRREVVPSGTVSAEATAGD